MNMSCQLNNNNNLKNYKYYSTYNSAYLIDNALSFHQFYLLFTENPNLIKQIILNITIGNIL